MVAKPYQKQSFRTQTGATLWNFSFAVPNLEMNWSFYLIKVKLVNMVYSPINNNKPFQGTFKSYFHGLKCWASGADLQQPPRRCQPRLPRCRAIPIQGLRFHSRQWPERRWGLEGAESHGWPWVVKVCWLTIMWWKQESRTAVGGLLPSKSAQILQNTEWLQWFQTIHDKQEVGEPFVGYIKKSVYNNSMYMYMIVIMATLATSNNSKEQFIEY